jgi:hypothetical protein
MLPEGLLRQNQVLGQSRSGLAFYATMTARRLRCILPLGASVQQPGIDRLISKSFHEAVAAVLAPFERLSLFIVGLFLQVPGFCAKPVRVLRA